MSSHKEKMLSGQLYSPVTEELTKERQHAKRLLQHLNADGYVVSSKTKTILKELLPNAAEDLYIEPPFHCDYGYNIHCGERVFFNVNCVVLDVVKVSIGSNVLFGPAVQLYTATHPVDAKTRRSRGLGKPIAIGNDCWIGGCSVICPGVTIGNNCVIGAGSVVTKNIPDNSMAVGNPARVIKKLPPVG